MQISPADGLVFFTPRLCGLNYFPCWWIRFGCFL